MRASGTFKVVAFKPAPTAPGPATPTGHPAAAAASMEKQYEGDIAGRSATSFGELGQAVAVESFEGTVGGLDGSFDFAHTATADAGAAEAGTAVLGSSAEEPIRILPSSGRGLLAGIRGTGGMAIDADGTHRIWFDYELG